MEFINLNPPSDKKEKDIWDLIKLAESKVGNNKSNQASYVRGMKIIFNLFTHDKLEFMLNNKKENITIYKCCVNCALVNNCSNVCDGINGCICIEDGCEVDGEECFVEKQ
jgi:hypothetical protein